LSICIFPDGTKQRKEVRDMSNNVLGTAYINAFPNMNNVTLEVRVRFEAIDFTPIKKGIEEAVANGLSEGMKSQSSAKDWIGLAADMIAIGEFLSPDKLGTAKSLFETIGESASGAAGWIGGLGDSFKKATPHIKANYDSLKLWAQKTSLKHISLAQLNAGMMAHTFKHGNLAGKFKVLGKAFKFIAPIALLAGAAFLLLNDDAREAFLGIVQNIIEAIPKIVAAVPELITGFVEAITGAIPLIIEGMGSLIEGIVGAVESIAPAIIDTLPVLIEGLVGLITSLVEAFVGFVPILLEAGVTLFSAIVTK